MNKESIKLEISHYNNHPTISDEAKKIRTGLLNIVIDMIEYQTKYNTLMYEFINKGNELLNLTLGMYQIENTIKLNKISLKGYILESKVCTELKRKGIKNYTIQELKKHLYKLDSENNEETNILIKATHLYELLEKIEQEEYNNNKDFLNKLGTVYDKTLLLNYNIDIKDKNKLNQDYTILINQITTNYINNNLIDDKVKQYTAMLINQIFTFMYNGNKPIPKEFISMMS